MRALLLGGIAFETPKRASNAQLASVEENHVFPLFADRDTAESASYTRKIPLVSYFPGSVSGLGRGSRVTMHGLDCRPRRSMCGSSTTEARTRCWRRCATRSSRNASSASVPGSIRTPQEAVDALIQRGLRATLQSASSDHRRSSRSRSTSCPTQTPVENGNRRTAISFCRRPRAAASPASSRRPTTLLNKVDTIPFDQSAKTSKASSNRSTTWSAGRSCTSP